jgi:hypothetical protein
VIVLAKKKRPIAASKSSSPDKPATLKDVLSADILEKLKAQAVELKEEEKKQKEESRKRAEEVRKTEEKRLENDFEYQLKNSSLDWRKFK